MNIIGNKFINQDSISPIQGIILKRLQMRRLLQGSSQLDAPRNIADNADLNKKPISDLKNKNSEIAEIPSNAGQKLLLTLVEAFLKIKTLKQKHEIIKFAETINNK